MLKLKTTTRAPAIRALAAAAGALALASVAQTAAADPTTACAPSGAAWDRASGSGDVEASGTLTIKGATVNIN